MSPQNSSNLPYASPILHISYWEFFQQYYTPMLQEMDVILKSMDDDESISISEAAKALALTEETVKEIMTREGLQNINQKCILQIAMYGNSPLCRLLQRQCLCGALEKYGPEHIAYIYGLQDEHVAEAYRVNGYTEVPAQTLQNILDKIYVFIMQ